MIINSKCSHVKIRLFNVFVEGSSFISQTLVDNFITTNGRVRCCGSYKFSLSMQGNLQCFSSFHTGHFYFHESFFILIGIYFIDKQFNLRMVAQRTPVKFLV